jgi:hypothetical protein
VSKIGVVKEMGVGSHQCSPSLFLGMGLDRVNGL